MKIEITWDNGKKEKITCNFREGEDRKMRDRLSDQFSYTTILIGDPPFIFYNLKHARKVEFIDD